MTKIGFVSEYFPPFTPGGAEWSTYYLAKDLSLINNIEVIVLTPNYGEKEFEKAGRLQIIRFPFYKKITNINSKLSEFDHSNPVWILWQACQILKFFYKKDLNFIHVHGKYSLIATYLANVFLRKKLYATIRDYQVICNYGFCIYNKNKSCDLTEYFKEDFVYYWNNYVFKKNLLNLVINLAFALWGRLNSLIMRYFAKHYQVIVLSKKQKEIFKANGFKKIEVINNSTSFMEKLPIKKRKKQLIFAGRLTLGKGVGMLIKILPLFFETYPNYKFVFAGRGILEKKILSLKRKYPGILVKGSIAHNNLLKIYAESELTVVPSIWQEPFGRIALESLSRGTPVIVTNRGGLPEIVLDQKWGYVVEANEVALLEGLEKGIKNNNFLLKSIESDYIKIKNKFGGNILKKYLKIYHLS